MVLCSGCSKHIVHQAKPLNPDCIRDKACHACVALAALDLDIHKAQDSFNSLWDRLQKRRLDAITEINRSHDPLIHKLPPEVASHIFAFYALAVAPKDYRDRHRLSPVQFVLASVCRVWRRIAFTTPELWATLNIVRSNRTWNFPVDLARQWIARSGQLPLDVTISWTQPARCPNPSPDASLLSATANLINEHYARLRNFRLTIPKAALPLFKANTSAPLASTLPNIELFIGVAVPSQMCMDWNSITRLEMGNTISMKRSWRILRRCRRIEISRFFIRTSDRSQIPTMKSPIRLQHLRVMIVKFSHDSPPQFFDTLTLPALQELRLHCKEMEDLDQFTLPFDHLNSMLERSSCSLRTLALSKTMTNDEELFRLLASIPSLECLSMDFNMPTISESSWFSPSLSDNFFNHFVSEDENANPTRPFLPVLHTLVYSGPQSFSWSTLVKIYELYSQPSPIVDLNDQRSGQSQTQTYQRPLQAITFITSGSEDDSSDDSSGDYIDRDSLIRFLELPKTTLKFKLEVNLLKASLLYHHITPSQDVLLYYGVTLNR